MRIVHFGVFSPYASGQYETVKDLIKAERLVGLEADFCDYGFDMKNPDHSRAGLTDGSITTIPLQEAFKADILMHHSRIPTELKKSGIPIVLCAHGRPEYSQRLEMNGSPIISYFIQTNKDTAYRGVITFWREHLFHLKHIMPDKEIFYVPAPIDTDRYSLSVQPYNYGEGAPHIMIADRWREDTNPFNLLFCAQYFRENFRSLAKLHVFGASQEGKNIYSVFQKSGLLGELFGNIKGLEKYYRGADILITPNIIATRVVREALASGIPIVAPHGARYAQFHGEPRDVREFGEAIENCWKKIMISKDKMQSEMRKIAEYEFGLERVGQSMKRVCERAVK